MMLRGGALTLLFRFSSLYLLVCQVDGSVVFDKRVLPDDTIRMPFSIDGVDGAAIIECKRVLCCITEL